MTIAATAWTFDGTSLNSYANYVRAYDESGPERRGDDVILGGLTGRMYVAKPYDYRPIVLEMIVDSRPSGGGARTGNQLQSNVDTIKKLFGSDGQHTLARTFGSLSLNAMVDVRRVRFQPVAPYFYNVAAELVVQDALWYATSATTVVQPFSTVPTNFTVTNNGSYMAEKMTIALACPTSPAALLTNPKVTIGSVWVKYNGVVGTGNTLTINTSTFTATIGTTDVTSAITHSGAVRWLVIPTGANTATVSADGISNTPTLTLSFYAPYL